VISIRVLARLAAATCAFAFAGCSMLPVITPDMAPADPSSVRFQTASGRILSPERSRQIVATLTQGGSASDLLADHLALEQELAGSPLSLGNRVTMLQNVPNTYAAMLDAIADAHDHINMETYIFDDDDAGQQFTDTLLAKQREGVQVNLIRDSVGTLSTPRAYFDRLQAAGIQVVEFNPVNPLRAKAGWDVNQRDHRKLLVVDGKTAVLDGINISSVYSGSSARLGGAEKKSSLPWRDTDLRIEGPVVASLQRLFVESWDSQHGPQLAPRNYFPQLAEEDKEVVRAIGSGPDQTVNQNYVTLISAINSAERDILLTNAYFVPDPQLIRALVAAVGRGVEVEMIVPSVTDSWLVFHAGRSHYEALLRGGVKIFERREALLHAKTALIDGVWATVGSTNLDWRSFLHNQELTAVILGPGFGEKMHEAFEHDLAASDQITLEAWERRPIRTRAKEWFGRWWEYWL
jgi:cardiolipin synthase